MGAQRPGWIGLRGENKPIARMPQAAAMCKGPVLAATKASLAPIKPISSVRSMAPPASIVFGPSKGSARR